MSSEPNPSEAAYRELLSLARVQRDRGPKLCLFLGAGCSLTSSEEDLSTVGVVSRYLRERDREADWADRHPADRYRAFVNSWLKLGSKDRNDALSAIIRPDMEPSPGYVNVARLAGAGYVEAIITTNFDNLIDKALLRYDVAYEFHCGANPPTNPTGKPAVVKLVKVHGGLHQCDLAFSPADLDELPKSLRRLVRELSESPMLVIGYSGQDRGVMTALSTSNERSAFWASPTAPSRADRATTDRVLVWLDKRVPKGDTFLTGDVYGRFDPLMTRLHDDLLAGGAPPVGLSPFRR